MHLFGFCPNVASIPWDGRQPKVWEKDQADQIPGGSVFVWLNQSNPIHDRLTKGILNRRFKRLFRPLLSVQKWTCRRPTQINRLMTAVKRTPKVTRLGRRNTFSVICFRSLTHSGKDVVRRTMAGGYSQMTQPLSRWARPALMRARVAEKSSLVCSPVTMSLQATTPSRISSSPRNTT